MSLNKQYKEKDYAESLLKKRSVDVGAKGDLKILAKYYKAQNKKYKEIEESLYQFANTKCKKWFKDVLHFKLIDSAVNFTKKKDNVLVQIESIEIYDSELNYINSLDYSYVEKKILFSMLVINKLKHKRMEIKGLEVDYDNNYFGGGTFSYKIMLETLQEKLTRTFKEKEIHKIIKKFNEDGIVRTTRSTSLELLFINEIEQSDNVMLEVKDFDTIGLYFDSIYKSDTVKICRECSKLLKVTTGNNTYCKLCSIEVNKRKTLENYYKNK